MNKNEEKQIRLDEVDLLEKFLLGHGVAGGVMSGYVQRRRDAIDVDFFERKPVVQVPVVEEETTPPAEEAASA